MGSFSWVCKISWKHIFNGTAFSVSANDLPWKYDSITLLKFFVYVTKDKLRASEWVSAGWWCLRGSANQFQWWLHRISIKTGSSADAANIIYSHHSNTLYPQLKTKAGAWSWIWFSSSFRLIIFCITHLILRSPLRSSHGMFCLPLLLGGRLYQEFPAVLKCCANMNFKKKKSIFLKGESQASVQRAPGNDGWSWEACYKHQCFCNSIYLFCA